jgi:hypothetical protein
MGNVQSSDLHVDDLVLCERVLAVLAVVVREAAARGASGDAFNDLHWYVLMGARGVVQDFVRIHELMPASEPVSQP